MFSWNFPYPSQRMPVLAKNIVATSQPLAAQAGLHAAHRQGSTWLAHEDINDVMLATSVLPDGFPSLSAAR